MGPPSPPQSLELSPPPPPPAKLGPTSYGKARLDTKDRPESCDESRDRRLGGLTGPGGRAQFQRSGCYRTLIVAADAESPRSIFLRPGSSLVSAHLLLLGHLPVCEIRLPLDVKRHEPRPDRCRWPRCLNDAGYLSVPRRSLATDDTVLARRAPVLMSRPESDSTSGPVRRASRVDLELVEATCDRSEEMLYREVDLGVGGND